MPNPNGHPDTLVPAPEGNTLAARHGIFSAERRVLEPRAREVAEHVLSGPHTGELDEVAAVELGRLVALIEACDADLAARGLTTKGGTARTLLDIRLRASRRLQDLLDRFGMTPRGRAELGSTLASGGLGAEIRRRIAEIEEREA